VKWIALFGLAAALGAAESPETQVRRALQAGTGVVTLPAGEIEVGREIVLPGGAHDLEIRGAGTTLKASPNFRGRALIVLSEGKNVKIHDLSLDGNRDEVGRMLVLPSAGTMYSRFVPDNGILAERVTGLEVARIRATRIAGFTLLVNGGSHLRIHDVDVTDSGGLSPQRRNNATGGLLLEEGSADFEIARCLLGRIRGNGITIRSGERGRIHENEFRSVARDAIEVTGGSALVIENNHAEQIGFPVEQVESPGALCLRLEHFEHGEVKGNTCSEALLGAVSLTGSDNRIAENHFTSLNVSRRDTPGVYLGEGAKDNTIENNEINGTGMSLHCVGVGSAETANGNKTLRNDCSDEASVAILLPAKRR
jgi:hypothetical protein